jgi:hypothetical protein
MRKTLALLLSGAAFVALLAGCYSTPEGSKRAGMPFGKDTFESRYQRSVPQIYAAARAVLELNGTLISENTIAHSYEAKVDNRTVVVKVDEVEPGVSRVLTMARKKGGVADADLAAEIDKQIALKLASTPAQR